jgi:hypothetical protein
MSQEKDWDNYEREELLGVAPSLLYLKRTFGTSIGDPDNSKPSNAPGPLGPGAGKQGDGGAA